ncbi:MAG: hypothetical protein QXL06_01800 [Nitrososphaerota archaeon]
MPDDITFVEVRENICRPFSGIATLNNGKRIFYFGGWWRIQTHEGVGRYYIMITDKEIDGKKYIFDNECGKILEELGIKIAKFPEFKPTPRWPSRYVKMYLNDIDMNFPVEDVYDVLQSKFSEYIDYGPEWGAPMLLALETIKSYLMPIFMTTGYIIFTGMRQTGKSKNLDLMEQVVFNPYRATEPSASAIFRGISDYQSTFLVDESDLDIPEKAPTIRTILLTGYKRGPMIPRIEKIRGEKLVPTYYDPFGPKIIVAPFGIATQGREAMLSDRSILINMHKTSDIEKTRKIINPNDPLWEEIRSHLYVFALKYWEKIEQYYLECGPELGFDSRNDEIWRPLYAVAKFFGVEKDLREYALEKIEMHMVEESESPEIKMLRFLVAAVKGDIRAFETFLEEKVQLGNEYLSGYYVKASDLESKLTEYYGKEKWITAQNIGRILTNVFGLSSGIWKKIRMGRPYYFLELKKLSSLAKRYGIDPERPLEL